MTLVKVCANALSDPNPRIWKPFYKRLTGIAGLKGYPFARCLPGLGFVHFDGKNFRKDGHVTFEFGDTLQDALKHNRFIDRLKQVPGVEIEVFTSNERYWDSI